MPDEAGRLDRQVRPAAAPELIPNAVEELLRLDGSFVCIGLRVAFDELVRRLDDLKLQPGADVDFHSTFNRAPLSVPITFTPGMRS